MGNLNISILDEESNFNEAYAESSPTVIKVVGCGGGGSNAVHGKRAEHILRLAAAKGIGVLVLGAFGCGVFKNDPRIVAEAWFDALEKYKSFFDFVEFAVYCRNRENDRNFHAFRIQKTIATAK